MSNLIDMQFALSAAAFVVGFVLARLLPGLGGSRAAASTDSSERDRKFRALEAESRVAKRKLEQADADLAAAHAEAEELLAELEQFRKQEDGSAAEIEDLRAQLADECEKTKSLRATLTERAEEGIRASVELRDAKTELSVVQAGSEAVQDEINELLAQHEELTARLHAKELEPTPAQDSERDSTAAANDRVCAQDC